MLQKNDGYIRWRCKSCGQILKVKDTYDGGNVIRCPKCRQPVNVPMGNLEAIAEATDMEETGKPGQIQLDPHKLIEHLEGTGEKADGPGSRGSTPSLRDGPWSAQAVFGRIEELDQLGSAITRINQETMGEVQRLYRKEGLNSNQRARQIEESAKHRRRQLNDLLTLRIQEITRKITPLENRREKLNMAELKELDRLQRVVEALRFYGRYVLGVDV